MDRRWACLRASTKPPSLQRPVRTSCLIRRHSEIPSQPDYRKSLEIWLFPLHGCTSLMVIYRCPFVTYFLTSLPVALFALLYNHRHPLDGAVTTKTKTKYNSQSQTSTSASATAQPDVVPVPPPVSCSIPLSPRQHFLRFLTLLQVDAAFVFAAMPWPMTRRSLGYAYVNYFNANNGTLLSALCCIVVDVHSQAHACSNKLILHFSILLYALVF